MLDFMVCWQGVKPCSRVPQWMGLSLPKGEWISRHLSSRKIFEELCQTSVAGLKRLSATNKILNKIRRKSRGYIQASADEGTTWPAVCRASVALLWALVSCRLATPVAAATRECAQNRLDSWREGTPLGQSYCGLVDHGVYRTSVTSSPMTSGDRLFSSAVLLIGGLMIAGG